MLRDSFRYATRSLVKRRLRSWLTIIGIFIGIAAVVSLISLAQGLQGAILQQFSSLGTDRITVQAKGGAFGPPGIGTASKLTEGDLDVVKRAAYIESAAGRLLSPVNVEYNDKAQFAIVASLPVERDDRALVENFLDPETSSGRLLEASDKGKIVVGSTFGKESTFDKQLVVGKSLMVNGVNFEVVGILEQKGLPQSDLAIIMNEDDLRDLVGKPEEYSIIFGQVARQEDVPFAKEAVMKDLRNSRNVDERKEDFSVETPEDIIATLNDVLGIVTGVLVGIAAISLLVGGIGITNTMYTAVLERKGEIGIMKAIGATNGQVLQLFLIESGLLGMVGGIIGILLGVGFSKMVEWGAAQALGPSVLQATSPWWLLVGALAFGFVVGTISGVLPAKQAAELPPVEALR